MNYKKEYEKLLKEYEEHRKHSIKWSIEDFTWLELEGWEISDKKAQEALEDMIRHHDAQYGIGWPTVEYYLMEYGKKVKVGKEKWRK